jgi:hypothetical protein
MDEIWARIGLLLGALAVAGLTVLVRRSRVRAPEREIRAPELAPGLYLFSSATCSTCEQARRTLVAGVGESGFEEYAWEQRPELFTQLDVTAVPAVLVMREGGRGKLYPGRVEKALADR